MDCCNVAEVLGSRLASPGYEAVMGWVPRARVLVVKLAKPWAFTGTGTPRGLPLSAKVTEPVGEGRPTAEAVNVTEAPTMAGFWLLERDMVEGARSTVRENGAEVLEPKA